MTATQNLRPSGKISQQKLMMMLFPVITLMAALLFYAFGGGRTVETDPVTSQGINTTLPDPQLGKDEPTDKMAYYDRAKQDAAHSDTAQLSAAAEHLGFRVREDEQTVKIQSKLAAINQQISAPYVAPKPYLPAVNTGYAGTAPISKDVDRLEALMKTMQEKPAGEDPEMAELNSMMDKLLAVQNPDLAKQIYKKGETAALPDSLFQAIPAVIAADQKAKQGSVVELRLSDTIRISGQVIPRGHLVYGLASFSNQRLNLEIKNIRLGTSIIPVNITVFDQRDGMPGINAPEALLAESVNGGISVAAGGIGISGFDLTTQIAGAGIDAAKNLLKKKVGKVKQNLKSGYPLLLRDNTRKNNPVNH
ncbi:MAG: conjugative transposon protein TraM [Bacteroidota bacterium]